jgi:hypothetical protein
MSFPEQLAGAWTIMMISTPIAVSTPIATRIVVRMSMLTTGEVHQSSNIVIVRVGSFQTADVFCASRSRLL